MKYEARQVDLGVSGGVGKQELMLCMLMGLGHEAWGLGPQGQDFGIEGQH